MKVSIIGTNGFLSDSIGRHCNRNNIQLDAFGLFAPERHQFANFYHINLIEGQISFQALKDSDIIIYASGAGIQSNQKESPDLIYALNVSAPVKIFNYLKSADYKGFLITFGSYFEIGENSENKSYTETELLQSQNRAVNDYAISKRMFSRYISSIELPFKTWHFILPTIYGEHESSHRLIPYTINALKANSEIEFTSGEQVRQYIYVDEISDIIFNSYEKDISSGVYNVAGAETLSVKELVSKLFKEFGKTNTDSVFGKSQRTDSSMKILKLNGTKLQKAINFFPNTKILDVYAKY